MMLPVSQSRPQRREQQCHFAIDCSYSRPREYETVV
jgi:hypothetical protein